MVLLYYLGKSLCYHLFIFSPCVLIQGKEIQRAYIINVLVYTMYMCYVTTRNKMDCENFILEFWAVTPLSHIT